MTEPNARLEKAWLNRVAEFAQQHGAFPHQANNNIELHHVAGRKAKHNKIHIGKWFVIPMMFDFHNPNSNHPLNVTHYRKRFTDRYGDQRTLWAQMATQILAEDGDLPFDAEVINAIADTRY
ncbi:hypothetical protein JCM19235_1970 [Vibrio maritimus]|uniref:Uncharacterized protein n=1 Tax=Vibrio maritimus TaxID=990268 RepID=A0A090SGF8_9VIBR|nr:hypothetical protein JCM19235_1970 [Vibrio maritimus]